MASAVLYTRKSLLDLPDELLTSITFLLELDDILSLSYTSLRFPSIVDDQLWRELDLSAHPKDCSCCNESSSAPSSTVSSPEPVIRRADKHKAEVRRKVREVLIQGNRRRWGKVESLKVAPRPGAVLGLTQIIELASPTLRKLVIQSGAYQMDKKDWMASDHAVLDVAMLEIDLSFPHLTHITIYHQSNLFAEFIPLLCNASPNLIYLDVDIEQIVPPSWMDASLPRFPDFERDTKIRQLRIWYGHDDEDFRNPVVRPEPSGVLMSLLKHIPLVQQLTIRYDPVKDYDIDEGAAGLAIMQLEHLRDLHWYHPFMGYLKSECNRLPSLRKFIIPPLRLHDIFEDMPMSLYLEIIHYDRSREYIHSSPENNSHIPLESIVRLSMAQAMTPEFRYRLETNPQLRAISIGNEDRDVVNDAENFFAEVEEILSSGKAAGHISSFRVSEDDVELLHARIFLDIVEVADRPKDDDASECTPTQSILTYHDSPDSERVKTFDMLSKPVWQYFTDYGLECVPLDIFERMREVEGLSKEDWYQRDRRVKKETWDVLLEWAAGSTAQPGANG